MLGRSERESGAHALAAAQLGGWDVPHNRDELSDILDLGSMTTALATVSRIADLRAVMHIGHPAQPDHGLERALLAAAPELRVTSAVAVTPEWVWVSRASDVSDHVVVDEAAMRDCRHVVRSMGASPHLVPTRTSLDERIALAGDAGSLVVERSVAEASLASAGFHEVPGSERLAELPPLWFGLVEPVATPVDFAAPAQVWLAFGPRDDHRGSLQDTLGLIAGAGFDLDHLRSQQSVAGPHLFLASFRCDGSDTLRALRAALQENGVAHRVLAVVAGSNFAPGADAVEPRWARPL